MKASLFLFFHEFLPLSFLRMKVTSSNPKFASFIIPLLCIAALVIIPTTVFLFKPDFCATTIYCGKEWRSLSGWGVGGDLWSSGKLWGIVAVGSPRVSNRCKEAACKYSEEGDEEEEAREVRSRSGSSSSSSSNNESRFGVACPGYFRWIERDLEPWKEGRISKGLLESAARLPVYEPAFRVVVRGGRLYAGGIGNCFQTRAVFTLWGLLQLLTFYRGLVPDVELVFGCGDKPTVPRPDVPDSANASFAAAGLPPVFRYCTTPRHLDIPFPDWSFWGWPEIDIQPWGIEQRSIEQGATKTRWKARHPKAYWKGNIYMGEGTRQELTKCSKDVAEISNQNWDEEGRNQFKNSKLSSQCKHRYKVYVEGIGWSVSLKYILACDSPVLLVEPKYLDFFTRGLVPNKHFLSIPPSDLCPTIASAVHWGNHHMLEAMEVGRAGSEFVKSEVSMTHVYDYMLHTLRGYAKLQDFEPTVEGDLVELCPNAFLCVSPPKERPFLEASMVHAPSQSPPCLFPSIV